MTKRHFFLILSFCFLLIENQAQEYEFDVYWRSRQIGHIDAHQEKQEDARKHHIRTDIVMPVLGKHIQSEVETQYLPKGLQWCRARYTMDGEMKEDRRTRRLASAFRLFRQDREPETLNTSDIPFTISCLYFDEPKGLSQIYSERHQKFLALENPRPGVYKLSLPKGNANHYHYQEGKLTKVEVQEGIFEVRFEASR
jgi:hypothetical protein